MRTTLLIAAILAFGCGGSDDDNGSDPIDASSSLDGAGADFDAAPPTGDNIVPADRDGLNVYLQAGSYLGFAAEPAAHPTAGPHLDNVRSFFNSTLDDSLRASRTDHPAGSAVIKELYNAGGGLGGWAVMVKTSNSAGEVAGDWYFYEVLSTTPGADPVLEGNGVGGCAGCHGSGTDYIRTSFP